MRKPQENYPGPRLTTEEPDYIQEWEAEPTRIQPEAQLEQGTSDQALHERVEQILKGQPMLIESCQLKVEGGRIFLSGVGSDLNLINQIKYAIRALPGVLEFQCDLRVR